MHPSGNFDAEVVEHGLFHSKEKGTLGVKVKFRTEHGEVFGTFWVTDKTAEYTVEKVKNMGFTGQSLAELNSDCLVGNRCNIAVNHRSYEDKVFAEVAFVNPEGGGFAIEKDEAAAANIKKFDGLLNQLRRHEDYEPPPPGGDDLPF